MKCKICDNGLDPFYDDTLLELCWDHSPSNPSNQTKKVCEQCQKRDELIKAYDELIVFMGTFGQYIPSVIERKKKIEQLKNSIQ